MSRLRDVRESKGVTAVAVARQLGVARQTYSEYENNPSKMSVEQALAVCSFLSCDIGDIFFGEEVNLTNQIVQSY